MADDKTNISDAVKGSALEPGFARYVAEHFFPIAGCSTILPIVPRLSYSSKEKLHEEKAKLMRRKLGPGLLQPSEKRLDEMKEPSKTYKGAGNVMSGDKETPPPASYSCEHLRRHLPRRNQGPATGLR